MAMMIVFIVLMTMMSHLAPQLTSRDIFFGVTVATDYREGPRARHVSRRYAMEIWLLALAAVVLAVTSPAPLLSGPGLMALGLGGMVAFVRARGAVLPYAVAD